MKRDYFEGVDVAVTICAKDGTILDMNQKSKKTSPHRVRKPKND